jgi:serine phosphatase RsbU (regulator of sigma subunit)
MTAGDIQKAKILIVDDLPSNVELIQAILRGAGYTSVQATTDPNAVCALHLENRYDLILLDLLMPGMDGFQVIEGLKAIEADCFLPVLVLTAQPAHKLRALEAGARDFITKPFDIAELQARVRNFLEVRLLHLQAKHHSDALEKIVHELEISREDLRRTALEERRSHEREAALGHETQKSLLPRLLPQFENFRIYAYNSPTRSVGGDFYEFLQLSGGDWTGVLADASGKGISAALLSSMTLGALHTELLSGTEPHEALNRLNKLLYAKSLPSQFVTLFLFRLQPDGSARFVSAGHTPVYVYRAATRDVVVFESDAYILGMF